MKRERWMKAVGIVALAFFALGVSILLPEPAQAQKKGEYKWRFGSPWTQKVRNDSLQMYSDLINKYSNGRIEVTFKHSGLFGTHDEIFHGVREGSLQMGLYAPYVNIVPGGMLNWMPWTVGTYAEAAIAYAPPQRDSLQSDGQSLRGSRVKTPLDISYGPLRIRQQSSAAQDSR